jgi:hypothetical protein
VGGPGARTGKRRPFNLNFHIDRGTFISADLDTLGEIDYSYSKLKMENYGIIRGSVNSEHISYTIQLLDKQGLRKQGEIKNKKEYSFGQVKPGDYFIRVLIDNNNNGKWDPGNIFKNMEPEDVYFFPNVITVRANWEITDIILEF